MPVVSAPNQVILRSSPQATRLGLVVFRPPIIASGTVSGSPADGARSITLSGYSATETPETYYSVVAGSSAGNDDGGKTRLKSINGSTLTLAANNIEWSDYPYVSILRVIEPWTILPDLENDLMDTDVSYSDANSNYHPLARIGPPAVGYVGEAVSFWSNSQALTGSITGHSWTFPDGTPSSSSSAGTAGSPINVTWNAATGHIPHYIKYTVTCSNGKTHTRYNPVWILDKFEDSYCAFEAESLSGDYSSGYWQGRLRVFGDATTEEFPSEAMIVVFARDTYAGSVVSIGGNWAGRENIVFMGWIVRGTTFKDDEAGSVSFEVVGPVGKMEQLLSWPANLEYKDSPASWNQLSGMTCDRAAFHMITERTTFDHICDINLTGNTKTLRYVDIPEGNVKTQLDEYCLLPIGARVLSDRQGQIYFSRNPNLRPLGERSSIPTVMALTLDDIKADPGLELGVEEQEKQCAQVDFIGFSYGGEDVEPFYSLAPQYQFETGTVEKVDGVRVDDQDEANVLSGMYLANFNNTFREIKAPSWNSRVWDIVPEEYTTLTLAAGDTKRGIVWTDQKLIARAVDFSYDLEDESLYVTPTFEKDSFGPPGVGGGYPKAPPRFEAYPYAEPFGVALAAWNGFYWRGRGENAWVERDELESVNHGCVDPWYVDRSKAGDSDPEKAILFACGAAGLVKRSVNAGITWTTKTIDVSPTNTHSDAAAPAVSDVEFIEIACDPWQNGRVYVLGRWQESGNDYWRGQLAVSDDDGVTWQWVELYDGENLPTQIKPLWMAVNGTYLLVTAWEDGDSDILRLLVFNAGDLSYDTEYNLGSATLSEVDARTYYAFPVPVLDDDNLWHVAGRMTSPAGLSGVVHIIRTTDAGSGWSSVANVFGEKHVAALEVGLLNEGHRPFYVGVQGAAPEEGHLVLGGSDTTDPSSSTAYLCELVKLDEDTAYYYYTYAGGVINKRYEYTAGSGIDAGTDISGSGTSVTPEAYHSENALAGTSQLFRGSQAAGFQMYLNLPPATTQNQLTDNSFANGKTKAGVLAGGNRFFLVAQGTTGSRSLWRIEDYTSATAYTGVTEYSNFFADEYSHKMHQATADRIVGVCVDETTGNLYGYIIDLDGSYVPTLTQFTASGGTAPVIDDFIKMSETEYWVMYRSQSAATNTAHMVKVTFGVSSVTFGTPIELWNSASPVVYNFPCYARFRDDKLAVFYLYYDSNEEDWAYNLVADTITVDVGLDGNPVTLYSTFTNLSFGAVGVDIVGLDDTTLLATYWDYEEEHVVLQELDWV